MNRSVREFLKITVANLDQTLASLTQEEQHDLLDSLAAEIEERLDKIIETEDGGP